MMRSEDIPDKEKLDEELRKKEQVNLLNPRDVHPVIHDGSCSRTENSHDRHRYLVHVLVTIYGIGACVAVNGISAEIPLLITSAPEGTLLPTHIGVMSSSAFTIPAIYALCVKFAPRLRIKNELASISGVLILATAAVSILAFFHDVTTMINGTKHSTVLLVIFFITALATGTRNVLLLPYLQKFGESYLTSFCIGEGLSGFLPSILALIQGVGGAPICANNATNSTHTPRSPNFPPRDYFLFVSLILASSVFAFWAMEYLRVKKLRRDYKADIRYNPVSKNNRTRSKKLSGREYAETITEETEMMEIGEWQSTNPNVLPGKKISNRDRICLYVMIWLVCFVAHGYLNTVEAYSSRPYGNSAHNLVVNLSQLASTAVCILGFWMPLLGIRGVTRILVLAAVGSAYVTWLALSSPMPLWHDTSYGVVVLVIVWIILMALIAYAKFAIVAIFYREPGNDGLYVIGFLALVGSVCGTTATFFVFNYTTLFKPYTACNIIE